MPSRQEIEQWFERGARDGATHMIVVCDTFDHSDYPVFVKPPVDVRAKEAECRAGEMQRVMEVYNLSEDKKAQLNELRAFNY